ncbi:MAG: ParB N-terminal domain-containing protein [Clostridium sp.]|nr:ParB N-terminal domain-containing protein [Clostridium sp.]
MKKKREMFTGDAIDFLTGSYEVAGVEELDINQLSAYRKHPFKLYKGERLEDMVESIRENGILVPVIVRKMDTGYEILSGHNRVNAAKIAGLGKVPCIVKIDLSDEDAYTYVVETNLMQRSFNELLTSEKALVIAERYETMKNQGKRNDIIRELKRLNGEKVDEPEINRESVGKEYGLSGSSVARLIRINHLTDAWKALLDDEKLSLLAGVELSYLAKDEQTMVFEIMDRHHAVLTPGKAKNIRALAKDNQLDHHTVLELLTGAAQKANYKSVKVSPNIYQKYFAGKTTKQAEEIIEKALEQYFS